MVLRVFYKHHYDKSTRQRRLKKGDEVLLHLPTSHNKLMLQWKGPYKVVEVVNRMDYRVKVDDRVGTYHINLLKKFEERDDTVIPGIIEAELNLEIDVVDDENLLNLVCLKGRRNKQGCADILELGSRAPIRSVETAKRLSVHIYRYALNNSFG